MCLSYVYMCAFYFIFPRQITVQDKAKLNAPWFSSGDDDNDGDI